VTRASSTVHMESGGFIKQMHSSYDSRTGIEHVTHQSGNNVRFQPHQHAEMGNRSYLSDNGAA